MRSSNPRHPTAPASICPTMSSTVYLITGANRGIGLAVTSQLAARPNATIFAGARDPSRAKELRALAEALPGRVHVVKIISSDRVNNDAAAEEIKQIAGRLDVIIANAGINDCFKSALEVPPSEIMRHFEVNTNGPLVLFQAMYALLRTSPAPKFVPISTGYGSIELGTQFPGDVYPYGASKAALNWVTRKLHHDFPELIVFPLCPGSVETGLATGAVEMDSSISELVKKFPFISTRESAEGIIEQVDIASRETHGGQFVDYTGLGKWAW